jgi:hypothetical protein
MATTPAALLVSATLRPLLPKSDAGIGEAPRHQRSRSAPLPQWRFLSRPPPPPAPTSSGASKKLQRHVVFMPNPAVDLITRALPDNIRRLTKTRDSAPLGFESPSTFSQPEKRDCELTQLPNSCHEHGEPTIIPSSTFENQEL